MRLNFFKEPMRSLNIDHFLERSDVLVSRKPHQPTGGNDMMLRAIVALGTGAAGVACGLLIANPLWAATAGLPTPLRYVAGFAVAIIAGDWLGYQGRRLLGRLTGPAPEGGMLWTTE